MGKGKVSRSRARARAAARKTPIDILTEQILPRIPVKSLLSNLSLVCREWLQLISSPRFTQIHLNYTSNQRPQRLLLMVDNGFLYYEDAPDAKISPKIPFPPKIACTPITILGSCDGLICIYSAHSHGRKLLLFNPSTRKYVLCCAGKQLRRSLHSFHVSFGSWFGRHPSTGEYTLVVVYSPPPPQPSTGGILILSKLNSLNCYYFPINLVDDKYRIQGIGTMLHGTLHWPAYFWDHRKLYYAVLGLDLCRNEMVEIPIPQNFRIRDRNAPLTLGVVDECLFVIFRNAATVFEVWVMREYGVMESWSKYASIDGYGHCNTLRAPLGFSPNGDHVLEGDVGSLYKVLERYSFRDRWRSSVIKGIRFSNNPAIAYVESLVSPHQIMYSRDNANK